MNKFLVRCTINDNDTVMDWQMVYPTGNDRLDSSDLLELKTMLKEEYGQQIKVFFDLIYKLGE